MPALYDILPRFPRNDTHALVIAIHMASQKTMDSMVDTLYKKCQSGVEVAGHGTPIKPGTIYFLPVGYHGKVIKRITDATISLNQGPKVNCVRPSIDVLMKSLAEAFKEDSVGVLLTGMGKDGALGMKAIKDAGGATLAQDELSSSVFAMPKSAIDLDCVDNVLSLGDIPDGIINIAREKTKEPEMQTHQVKSILG